MLAMDLAGSSQAGQHLQSCVATCCSRILDSRHRVHAPEPLQVAVATGDALPEVSGQVLTGAPHSQCHHARRPYSERGVRAREHLQASVATGCCLQGVYG